MLYTCEYGICVYKWNDIVLVQMDYVLIDDIKTRNEYLFIIIGIQ